MAILDLILISSAVFFLYYLYQLIVDPLQDIPGPLAARFTRLWLFRNYLKGDFEKTNISLHEKHGPIVRIAPGQYSIDDTDAAKIIYGHGSDFRKSEWYMPWGSTDPRDGNLFQIRDPHQHSALRRKTANAYSMSSLVSYEPHVDNTNVEFERKLGEFAGSGEGCNMGHWFQCYAFEMVGKITFSSSLGFLKNGSDISGIMAALEFGLGYSSAVGVLSFLHHPFMYLLRRFGSDPRGPDAIWSFADTLTATRTAELSKSLSGIENGPSDFIEKMTAIRAKEPSKMTDRDINIVVRQNIAAGSDTTSITLSAILYYLLRNLSCLAKLRAELSTASSNNAISDPITFKEAQELPYLQAVIKEALRIHPATGFTMPRVVPKGGKTLAGRFFPEGTVVGINAWVAHRNRAVFGEDADMFRPERWIEESGKEKTAARVAYFFAFGQGSRTCIGKNISLLEISKVIPRLVQNFDFELLNGVGAGEKGKEWSCKTHWFVKPLDFEVRVKRREGGVGE